MPGTVAWTAATHALLDFTARGATRPVAAKMMQAVILSQGAVNALLAGWVPTAALSARVDITVWTASGPVTVIMVASVTVLMAPVIVRPDIKDAPVSFTVKVMLDEQNPMLCFLNLLISYLSPSQRCKVNSYSLETVL